ncbi:phage baseplate protein [Citrobacter sp. On2M]|uniref:phage baseplate protein n=1 Tax=Citrobacter sp. On2M TaxID=2679993 RepID=UPI001B376BE1|nr:phage baseplate protein [Citrobacter sp. On28M]MBP8543464.1 phage baseplate protein [Citrobacter sp. On2M]MBW5274209.1 phage baseplate protein [Citrobacter sp. On28M]
MPIDSNQFTPTNAQINDAESIAYAFKMLMSGYYFIEIVMVMEVRGEDENLVVDVLPLLSRTDRTGAPIKNSVIYDIPVFRLQSGNSAVVIDPTPGDIGQILVNDRDTTLIRANRKESTPGSARTHSKSDATYLGGILNAKPTEFVKFTGSGINIKSPGTVNINGLKILPDGRLQLVDGSIVDAHTHGGVSPGGSNTAPLEP